MEKDLELLVDDLNFSRKYLKGERQKTAESAYKLAYNSKNIDELLNNLKKLNDSATEKMIRVKFNDQTNGRRNYTDKDKKYWKKKYPNSLLTELLS